MFYGKCIQCLFYENLKVVIDKNSDGKKILQLTLNVRIKSSILSCLTFHL